jgi:hypothetical protein
VNRSLEAIFCDDVRLEAGNKLSLMGCYSGMMIVPHVPIVLPKLCVFMRAVSPHDQPFKMLRFRLVRDETVISEIEVPEADLKPPPKMPHSEGEEHNLFLQQVFQVYPLEIKETCKFRARAITENGEMKGGTLVVSLAIPPA